MQIGPNLPFYAIAFSFVYVFAAGNYATGAEVTRFNQAGRRGLQMRSKCTAAR